MKKVKMESLQDQAIKCRGKLLRRGSQSHRKGSSIPPPPAGSIRLDKTRLKKVINETERVRELLNRLFSENPPQDEEANF